MLLWLAVVLWVADCCHGFCLTYDCDTNVQKIIVNRKTDDVYVGGRNVFLHLNRNLLLAEPPLILGPVDSSQSCEPHDPKCTTLNKTTNDVEVLKWLMENEKILLCGSAHQGLCQVHSQSSISNVEIMEAHSSESRIGSKNSTIVVPFTAKDDSSGKCFQAYFVGQSYDGRDTEYFDEEFSFLKFHKLTKENGKTVPKFGLQSRFSKLGHCDSKRQSTEIRFIYGFESCDHVYSIFVKSRVGDKQNYETKIARFCKNDMYMRSYIDMTIDCDRFNLVTAGYFDKRNLYLSFGVATESPYPDLSDGSKVCKYTMKNITDKFYNVYHRCTAYSSGYSPPSWTQKGCTQGKNCSFILEPYDGIKYFNDSSCYDVKTCPSERSFCGSPKIRGIEGDPSVELNNGEIIHEDKTVLTSIFVHESQIIDQPGREDVVYMGTQDGYILKLQTEGRSMKQVAKYDVSGDRTTRVEPDISFDGSKKNVYLLSGKKVTKMPLDTCRIHTRCGDCVTSNDLLGCGWCRDECVRQVECATKWYNTSCPPFIHSIYPETGPLEGSTLLTINGENFGNKTAEITAMVGNMSCNITDRNSTRITCLTSSSMSNISSLVQVYVTDTSKSNPQKYNIRGVSEIQEIYFSYLNSEITSFSPDKGPIHGNTLLTLNGQNLDIGRLREITTAEFPCDVIWNNGTTVQCRTATWERVFRNSSRTQETDMCLTIGNVEMRIDGSINTLTSFCYMEDPKFMSLGTNRSIVSGGILVNVTGNHFDAVSSYKMQIFFPKENLTTLQNCQLKMNSTEEIACYTPDLSSLDNRKNLTFPLIGQLNLLLDDDLYYWRKFMGPPSGKMEIRVYPDPEFEDLLEGDSKNVHLDKKLLDIKGENLNLGLRPEDINVTVQGVRCPVVLLRQTILHCNISEVILKYPGMNEILEIVVQTGNLIHNIGRIKFIYTAEGQKLEEHIYLLVIIGVCLFLIVLICCCLKINHIKPFGRNAKQCNIEPSVSFHASAGPVEVTPFLGLSELSNNNEQQESSQNVYTGDRWERRETEGTTANDYLCNDDTIYVLEKQNLLVEGDYLRLGEDVGRGNFGCVYKGYLTRPGERAEIVVAVKTILRTGTIDVNSFLTEALIMKDFNHPNVLSLIGISINKGEFPMIIVPFMDNGSLLTYIRDERNAPTVRDLVKFGLDIANGMEYFSSIKFIHRDLAARNCMLDGDFNVKVADFGLSRDVYSKEYYSSDNKQKLPVKWMAPESLEKGNYSSKSDVWSFGVVLWELMTRGAFPYPEVDNWDMNRYLQIGRRLPRPEYCPVSMYDTMQHCWREEPNIRPSFKDLREAIENILDAKSHINNTEVDLGKCTIYHYTEQGVKQTLQSQFSTTSEDAALLPQTE